MTATNSTTEFTYPEEKPNTYYVTLINDLSGYAVKFKARSEAQVRLHCTKNYGRLWGFIYTSPPPEPVLTTINIAHHPLPEIYRANQPTDHKEE